jgi:hypothetical protein
MSEDKPISLKEYVDTRFDAQDKATSLALETVKVAMDKDDRKTTTLLSFVSIILTVALGVYTLTKHLIP